MIRPGSQRSRAAAASVCTRQPTTCLALAARVFFSRHASIGLSGAVP
jgi:hypothetical protein